METIKAFWESLVQFLKDYDATKVAHSVSDLDWGAMIGSPIFWVVAVALGLLVIWKRAYRLVLFGGSVVVFAFLLQNTLPPGGESIPLNKLVTFLLGSVALAGVNIYFLIMRH